MRRSIRPCPKPNIAGLLGNLVIAPAQFIHQGAVWLTQGKPFWNYGNVVAVVKATFSLDPKTVGLLADAARRLAKPKSEIVRGAIRDYCARIGRLSEEERLRLLAVFDDLVPKIPERPQEEVDRELREIRESRRTGGRSTPVD